MTDAELQHLARAGYDAYSAAVGGVAFNGDPLPEFEQTPPKIQAAWRVAAGAILSAHAGPADKTPERLAVTVETVPCYNDTAVRGYLIVNDVPWTNVAVNERTLRSMAEIFVSGVTGVDASLIDMTFTPKSA